MVKKLVLPVLIPLTRGSTPSSSTDTPNTGSSTPSCSTDTLSQTLIIIGLVCIAGFVGVYAFKSSSGSARAKTPEKTEKTPRKTQKTYM